MHSQQKSAPQMVQVMWLHEPSSILAMRALQRGQGLILPRRDDGAAEKSALPATLRNVTAPTAAAADRFRPKRWARASSQVETGCHTPAQW